MGQAGGGGDGWGWGWVLSGFSESCCDLCGRWGRVG